MKVHSNCNHGKKSFLDTTRQISQNHDYPGFPEVWSNKGLTLEKLRRHDEAQKCFNKGVTT